MPEKRIVLQSPFNGGVFVAPPESTPEFVEALLARGFVRMRDPERPAKESRIKDTEEEHAHG